MLARPYWCLFFARAMIGVLSAILTTAGLALIVENVEKERVGIQKGFAMSGITVGS